MDFVEILRWTASGTGIIAALMVAAHISTRITGYGFVIFTFSSMLWITAAFFQDQDPLAMQNIILFGINLFGIYRYLWRNPDKKTQKAPASA
ncbi:hypothetical protein [Pyruvatibacter mobilis]|jgi:hypothetical protein|uniref:hypothetical protein n=2 Tax=Pyruvatibacter mobilis TaxID=1712261 RepID=UPI000413F1B0